MAGCLLARSTRSFCALLLFIWVLIIVPLVPNTRLLLLLITGIWKKGVSTSIAGQSVQNPMAVDFSIILKYKGLGSSVFQKRCRQLLRNSAIWLMFYSLGNNNQINKGDGFSKGECELRSLNSETFRFTVPPADALLNLYDNKISSTLSQIFLSKLGFFAGISHYYRRWEKRSNASFCVLMVFYSIPLYK